MYSVGVISCVKKLILRFLTERCGRGVSGSKVTVYTVHVRGVSAEGLTGPCPSCLFLIAKAKACFSGSVPLPFFFFFF